VVKNLHALEKKSLDLKNEQENVSRELDAISCIEQQKLFDAVKNQRWYFFKNKKKVIFDKNTAYLWTNQDYLEMKTTHDKCKDYLEKIKSIEIEGFKNWQNCDDNHLIDIMTMPTLKDKDSRIMAKGYDTPRIGLSLDGSVRNYTYDAPFHFFPFNDSLVPENYLIDTQPENKIFSENEKAQIVLDIFVNNNLIPIFDDNKANDIYNNIYIKKPELIKRLAEINEQLENSKGIQSNLNGIDFENMIQSFDLVSCDNSTLNFAKNGLKVIDIISKFTNDIKVEQSGLLKSASILTESVKNTANEYKHHNIIEERSVFMEKMYDFSISSIEAFLFEKKTELTNIKNEFFNAKNLNELKVGNTLGLPSFYVFAQFVVEKTNQHFKRLEFFSFNSDLLSEMAEIHEEWSKDFDIFTKKIVSTDFCSKCKKEFIPEEKALEWSSEWMQERELIESKLSDLIKAGFDGVLPFEIVIEGEKTLQKYKEELYKFYIKERFAIYQKTHSHSQSSFLDKLYKEENLFKIITSLDKGIAEILFKIDTSEGRIFFSRWAQSWTNIFIEQFESLGEEKEINDLISNEILAGFREIRTKSFDSYLVDSIKYAEMQKSLVDDVNALIYKMKFSLEAETRK
jgi:hypothetical protein